MNIDLSSINRVVESQIIATQLGHRLEDIRRSFDFSPKPPAFYIMTGMAMSEAARRQMVVMGKRKTVTVSFSDNERPFLTGGGGDAKLFTASGLYLRGSKIGDVCTVSIKGTNSDGILSAKSIAETINGGIEGGTLKPV
jgi:hypothetical protein